LSVAADGSSAAATSGVAGANPIGWTLTNTSAGTYYLDGLNGAAATPANTIIGGAAGNTYASANSSIAGNGPHNPFVAGTGHFVLSIAGVSASTNITSAIFSFGTASGNNTTGVNTPVPEPAYSFLLLGAGLAFVAFRKKFGTA